MAVYMKQNRCTFAELRTLVSYCAFCLEQLIQNNENILPLFFSPQAFTWKQNCGKIHEVELCTLLNVNTT